MTDKIHISIGGTYNIGNFENVKMDVGISQDISDDADWDDVRAQAIEMRKALSPILKSLADDEIRARRI